MKKIIVLILSLTMLFLSSCSVSYNYEPEVGGDKDTDQKGEEESSPIAYDFEAEGFAVQCKAYKNVKFTLKTIEYIQCGGLNGRLPHFL